MMQDANLRRENQQYRDANEKADDAEVHNHLFSQVILNLIPCNL